MQTVNFQCGHCGKLMAVGRENLGQQVRCPHCQQVVLAPSSEASAPAPEPSPFGDLHEHEDIFTEKSETEDVLFGQGDAPRLERRGEPEPLPFSTNGPSAPDLETMNLPAPDPALSSPPLFVNEPPLPPPSESLPWSPAASSSAAVQEEPAFVPPRQQRERKESFVSPMFLLLVYLPTLLWAVGATGIGYWLYTKAAEQNNKPDDPFNKLIDDGDDAGVKKSKSRVRNKMQTTEKFATSPLPDTLKVKLGETVVVGDLEVTPIGVSRKRVGIMVEGSSKPQPCEYDSLVLDLKFKNRSSEYAFAPLDNYFDRTYKGIGPAPLTLVQAGEKTFFGGAHEWVPLVRSAAAKLHRQWPEGRKNTDPVGLRPGEESTGFVCTNGWEEKTAAFLFGSENGKQKPYRGALLWRVQLRRGPHEHKGRMLSATSVIGVEFTERDYLN